MAEIKLPDDSGHEGLHVRLNGAEWLEHEHSVL
jgi:hypothetical protein